MEVITIVSSAEKSTVTHFTAVSTSWNDSPQEALVIEPPHHTHSHSLSLSLSTGRNN